jgi:hypothetical protein
VRALTHPLILINKKLFDQSLFEVDVCVYQPNLIAEFLPGSITTGKSETEREMLCVLLFFVPMLSLFIGIGRPGACAIDQYTGERVF